MRKLEDPRVLLEEYAAERREVEIEEHITVVIALLADPDNDVVEQSIYATELQELRRLVGAVVDEPADVTEYDLDRLAFDGITVPRKATAG